MKHVVIYSLLLLILVAVISIAGEIAATPEQEAIMARRDAERAASAAIRLAKNKIALIPGIPKAELTGYGNAELNNDNFVSFMREQNDLIRQQNAILLRIAEVIAPVNTNVVMKLEKE